MVEVLKDQGFPLPDVRSVEEVVGACLKHSEATLVFPNYSPTPQELAILENWGEGQKIEFHIPKDGKFTARRIV